MAPRRGKKRHRSDVESDKEYIDIEAVVVRTVYLEMDLETDIHIDSVYEKLSCTDTH